MSNPLIKIESKRNTKSFAFENNKTTIWLRPPHATGPTVATKWLMILVTLLNFSHVAYVIGGDRSGQIQRAFRHSFGPRSRPGQKDPFQRVVCCRL